MRESIRNMFPLCLILLVFASVPVAAQEYRALEGVKGLDTVFDYAQGSPDYALVVFPVMRDVYQDKSVTSLPNPPRTVIVFHGPAVKLLTTDRQGDAKNLEVLDQVAEQISQFKKDGVRLEVCMAAVRIMGVDPDTLLPGIEQVGNGFISVAGYQAKGYSVISIP